MIGVFADSSVVPNEAVHHVAGDSVLLHHQGDGLFGVEGRVAFSASFGVADEGVLQLPCQMNQRQR